MIETVIRWIGLAIGLMYYSISALVRYPFGTSGSYLRGVGGSFGHKMLAIAGGKPEFEWADGIDATKNYVFVGNHQSYADIFLIFAALGTRNMKVVFVMKRELFRIPLMGFVAKHMGLIPIEREDSRAAFKNMLNSVKKVKDLASIAIFPEGSRTKDGEIHEFKRGAFIIAESAGMPIVPFVITGTGRIIQRNMKIKSGKCKISFLPPINPEGMSNRELTAAVEKMVKDKYIQMRGNE